MRHRFIIINLGLWTALGISCFSCGKDETDLAPTIRPISANSSRYVTTLVEYKPAPGQFINTSLGNQEAANSILETDAGLVTLGGYGGYIILGFDHSVINQSGKEDFVVVGNATAQMAEPGIIWVMQDENGNGQADDTWHEIAGSEFGKTGYIRDYQVTYQRPDSSSADIPWQDNQGIQGILPANSFHKQPYYPEWISENSYTLPGSLLPSNNIDLSNPVFITSTPFKQGYADNTVGGDKIDLDWAVDRQGNPVHLKAIDFVKIQTGIQANLGTLGEFSTEVKSVEDLNMP